MRRLIFITAGLLIFSSVTIENRSSAQNRRRAARSQSPVISQDVKPVNDDRTREIEECATPGRPKPEVEGKQDSLGLCGKAISLPKPNYPAEAKAQHASGRVVVNVVTDEQGYVTWAKVTEGHPLLEQAALKAACQSRYSPEMISKRAIKVSRVISYNFVDQ